MNCGGRAPRRARHAPKRQGCAALRPLLRDDGPQQWGDTVEWLWWPLNQVPHRTWVICYSLSDTGKPPCGGLNNEEERQSDPWPSSSSIIALPHAVPPRVGVTERGKNSIEK